ncbi:FHA domain-containing protein [Nitrospira sp. NS4]|uniref:FHA domain-containing protein n=1 Tax=Nitrospira sp. NS4 TaxID=3414498 RepID=UPI003C2D51FD
MHVTTTQQAALLVKLHGKASEERLLSADTYTIGRKADNHLVIDDAAVSGHHARIVHVQAVYFLEDLKSTNGTLVNDRRIERHQLRDTDIITIGRHRIIFRDTAPDLAPSPDNAGSLDRTMVISKLSSPADTPLRPPRVRVLSGKTAQQDYAVTKHVTIIGADSQAAIRLTSWFAPKTAAMITRRTAHYLIGSGRSGKPVLVNGKTVSGEQTLKEGDRIEVAEVTLLWTMQGKTTA